MFARGLMDVQLQSVPIGFGVLTTDTLAQAQERADPARGDKGYDAAVAALSVLALLPALVGAGFCLPFGTLYPYTRPTLRYRFALTADETILGAPVQDKNLTCKDCGSQFVFSVRDQQFYLKRVSKTSRSAAATAGRSVRTRAAQGGRGRCSRRLAPSATSRRPCRSSRAATSRSIAGPATRDDAGRSPLTSSGRAPLIRRSACERASSGTQKVASMAAKRCGARTRRGGKSMLSATSISALPHELVRREPRPSTTSSAAIATLAVRGAPCIGIIRRLRRRAGAPSSPGSDEAFAAAAARIRAARPTAVNLAWAVDRVLAAERGEHLAEARAIHDEQRAVDRAIGEHGAALFPNDRSRSDPLQYGAARDRRFWHRPRRDRRRARSGKRLHVYVDETRPLLQGARLTTVELAAAGVPATLIVDGAPRPRRCAQKGVAAVIVGADRIARNGDTANKIGTYGVAIAAAHHGIPFYVAAPRSTIDFTWRDGDGIAIEERAADEVRAFRSARPRRSDSTHTTRPST
jgi:methylthioribose-1-phosphate isomerase